MYLISADEQKYEKLLTDLESRKNAGTISAMELEKKLQVIGEQLDQPFDENL